MNQMSMAGMNGGNSVVGGMPMMNNMPNGAMARQASDQGNEDDMARLNTWIYSYLMEQGQYDTARSLKNSSLAFNPPIVNSEDEMNGINEDSKAGIRDDKKPPDLPIVKGGIDTDGCSMLSGWFAVFWDIFTAQRRAPGASKAATQLMDQNRMRGQGLRTMNGVMQNPMDPNFQQMMRMNNDLRQKALQNQQQNGYRGMTPQMQMAMQRNAMMQQQGMRRDPSGMEMNGQRPRTPSSGDHAPSPKRPRMDGAGFNPQQMMQNGRPPPGMPPQMMPENAQQANALLVNSGINPANLSETQFASFQQQQPAVQQKSIQVYAQNLAKNQREGMSKAGAMSEGDSPLMPDAMNMTTGGPDFYGANGQMMRAGAMGPNPGANGAGGNHALQDYQMQLMLLEQQNKKRLLMARQEQDGPGQPGIAGGFAPVMSPSGSRGGPSPGPGGERRGTPKLGPPGMDGSPLPDGSMRGSPAAMNTFNAAQQDAMYAQMGVRPPPSSNPAFNGQFNPQQMQQMRQDVQGRMPSGNWQGPPGQGPMGQQPPIQQQPPQMGTPQQRNDMPPPQNPAAGAANGRNGSDDLPPTPQPPNKSNPKPKKDSKKSKGEGKGKKSSNSVAATPASEAENPPPTPTPSTPITPSHPQSFNQKEAPQPGATQTNNAAAQQMPAPQQDMNVPPQFNATAPADDADGYNSSFNDQMQGNDLLDNFNFEEFLDNTAFQLDLSQVDMGDMMEPPMADAA